MSGSGFFLSRWELSAWGYCPRGICPGDLTQGRNSLDPGQLRVNDNCERREASSQPRASINSYMGFSSNAISRKLLNFFRYGLWNKNHFDPIIDICDELS